RSNVNLAYRIIKFQVIGPDESETVESTVKIYKTEQSSITGAIDFTDVDLLAAALYQQNVTGQSYPLDVAVIFDNEIFSQNIYVSQKGGAASANMNYYIELEEVPVNSATLMQLKLGVARKLNLSESAPDA
ncbi:unnamed protein product, partial [marine sediment metagenome]